MQKRRGKKAILLMVAVSQSKQMLNHCVLHLKLIYINCTSIKKKEEQYYCQKE